MPNHQSIKIQASDKMPKIKTSTLLFISLFFLTITTNQASANSMFNRFKKGFYFEKYQIDTHDMSNQSDEAREALLKLHPIGSSVDDLVKTLEKAGAKCNIFGTRTGSYKDTFEGKEFTGKQQVVTKKEKITEPTDYIACYYYEPLPIIFFIKNKWVVVINVNTNKNITIKDIMVRNNGIK